MCDVFTCTKPILQDLRILFCSKGECVSLCVSSLHYLANARPIIYVSVKHTIFEEVHSTAYTRALQKHWCNTTLPMLPPSDAGRQWWQDWWLVSPPSLMTPTDATPSLSLSLPEPWGLWSPHCTARGTSLQSPTLSCCCLASASRSLSWP